MNVAVAVNEQNVAALAFYDALGFVAVGRSPRDGTRRPFAILHLRRHAPPRRGAPVLQASAGSPVRSVTSTGMAGRRQAPGRAPIA
jgi:hypothetical protein